MQTVVETINSYSKKLKVQLSPEDLVSIEQKVVQNYQRRADIPGFRPGKAPLGMIRQRYKDVIQQELVEEALRKFYGKALDEAKITPVSEGKITDLKFENIQSGLGFDIEVEVEPDVEIKKYKGLKVDKDIVEVSEEMVDEALERLREQYATVKEVTQAREGHFVHFEAQELDKGDVPIVGHKYDNLQVELGTGKFDPEIEKQLTGVKKGEKRIVRQEIPPPPGKKEAQPRINSLRISVNKIEEKEFPTLNDDFVKNFNEKDLQTLEQLRERIKKNIQLDLNHRNESNLQNRLVDELLKENPFEVPPGMVENYLGEMIRDIKKQSKGKPVDEDSVRKEYRASAIHNLRWHFLKRLLIKQEGLSVPEEELLKLIDESDLDPKIKKQARDDQHYLDHLRDDILERKVMEILKSQAEITEVYPLKKNPVKKTKDKKQ